MTKNIKKDQVLCLMLFITTLLHLRERIFTTMKKKKN